MRRILATLFLMLFAATSAFAQSGRPSIELIQGTLNGRPIRSLGVDDISTMFGRPSSIDDGRYLAGIMGPQIHYHNLGLSFWMKGKKYDPAERVSLMSVYLARTWSSQTKNYFQQFTGTLTKDISGNWRADRTASEFAEYGPTTRSPEQLEQDLKRANVYKPGTALNLMVQIKVNGLTINFLHEPVTKFLEQISVHTDGK